jgi:hypothetical protein
MPAVSRRSTSPHRTAPFSMPASALTNRSMVVSRSRTAFAGVGAWLHKSRNQSAARSSITASATARRFTASRTACSRHKFRTEFAADSSLEDGVTSELVSGSLNSLLAGNIQGNSSTFASVSRFFRRKDHSHQGLTIKFPMQPNRELIVPYQRIKSAYQGTLPPDQGSSSGREAQPVERPSARR